MLFARILGELANTNSALNVAFVSYYSVSSIALLFVLCYTFKTNHAYS